jgi:hypothetical protein
MEQEWTPGQRGKAAIYGSLHEPLLAGPWAVDAEGYPNHYVVMPKYGIHNFIALDVDPEGGVSVLFGDPKVADDAAKLDSRLHIKSRGPHAEGWNFSSVPFEAASRPSKRRWGPTQGDPSSELSNRLFAAWTPEEPIRPWQPGSWGKGSVHYEGPVVHWQTSGEGDMRPTHMDVLSREGLLNRAEPRWANDPEQQEWSHFVINPQGEVQSVMTGAWTPSEHNNNQVDDPTHEAGRLLAKEIGGQYKPQDGYFFGKTAHGWHVQESDFDPELTFYPAVAGNPSRDDQRVVVTHKPTRQIIVGQPGTHHGDLIHHHGLDLEAISDLDRDERQWHDRVEEDQYHWTKDEGPTNFPSLHYGWISNRGGFGGVGQTPEGVTEALHARGLLQQPDGSVHTTVGEPNVWHFGRWTPLLHDDANAHGSSTRRGSRERAVDSYARGIGEGRDGRAMVGRVLGGWDFGPTVRVVRKGLVAPDGQTHEWDVDGMGFPGHVEQAQHLAPEGEDIRLWLAHTYEIDDSGKRHQVWAKAARSPNNPLNLEQHTSVGDVLPGDHFIVLHDGTVFSGAGHHHEIIEAAGVGPDEIRDMGGRVEGSGETWHLNDAEQEMRKGWAFASTATGHELNWQPGTYGKGILYRDGSLQTWTCNDEGEPHHQEEIMDRGAVAQYLLIDPGGETGSSNWDELDPRVLQADPRLKPAPEGWHFSNKPVSLADGRSVEWTTTAEGGLAVLVKGEEHDRMQGEKHRGTGDEAQGAAGDRGNELGRAGRAAVSQGGQGRPGERQEGHGQQSMARGTHRDSKTAALPVIESGGKLYIGDHHHEHQDVYDLHGVKPDTIKHYLIHNGTVEGFANGSEGDPGVLEELQRQTGQPLKWLKHDERGNPMWNFAAVDLTGNATSRHTPSKLPLEPDTHNDTRFPTTIAQFPTPYLGIRPPRPQRPSGARRSELATALSSILSPLAASQTDADNSDDESPSQAGQELRSPVREAEQGWRRVEDGKAVGPVLAPATPGWTRGRHAYLAALAHAAGQSRPSWKEFLPSGSIREAFPRSDSGAQTLYHNSAHRCPDCGTGFGMNDLNKCPSCGAVDIDTHTPFWIHPHGELEIGAGGGPAHAKLVQSQIPGTTPPSEGWHFAKASAWWNRNKPEQEAPMQPIVPDVPDVHRGFVTHDGQVIGWGSPAGTADEVYHMDWLQRENRNPDEFLTSWRQYPGRSLEIDNPKAERHRPAIEDHLRSQGVEPAPEQWHFANGDPLPEPWKVVEVPHNEAANFENANERPLVAHPASKTVYVGAMGNAHEAIFRTGVPWEGSHPSAVDPSTGKINNFCAAEHEHWPPEATHALSQFIGKPVVLPNPDEWHFGALEPLQLPEGYEPPSDPTDPHKGLVMKDGREVYWNIYGPLNNQTTHAQLMVKMGIDPHDVAKYIDSQSGETWEQRSPHFQQQYINMVKPNQEWRFANEAETGLAPLPRGYQPWQLGQNGKGWVHDNGQVYLWKGEQYANDPHHLDLIGKFHSQQQMAENMADLLRNTFTVSRDGQVLKSVHVGLNDDAIDKAVAAHPDLRAPENRDSPWAWNFTANRGPLGTGIQVHMTDDPGSAGEWESEDFDKRRPLLFDPNTRDLYVGGYGQYHNEAVDSHGLTNEWDYAKGCWTPEGVEDWDMKPGGISWFHGQVSPEHQSEIEQKLNAKTEDPDVWHFGATGYGQMILPDASKSRLYNTHHGDAEPWELGDKGKGFIHNGQGYLWRDGPDDPHHPDMLMAVDPSYTGQSGIVQKTEGIFEVTPEGEVVPSMWEHGNAEQFAAKHPDLRARNSDEWHFGAVIQPPGQFGGPLLYYPHSGNIYVGPAGGYHFQIKPEPQDTGQPAHKGGFSPTRGVEWYWPSKQDPTIHEEVSRALQTTPSDQDKWHF